MFLQKSKYRSWRSKRSVCRNDETHVAARHQTAALRYFEPALDRFGSKPEWPLIALMSAFANSCGHTIEQALDCNVPCMDGARSAREKNLTFRETIRVQPCIRPLNAAVVAAGPDVIH